MTAPVILLRLLTQRDTPHMFFTGYVAASAGLAERLARLPVTGGGQDVGVDANRNRYGSLRLTYRQVL